MMARCFALSSTMPHIHRLPLSRYAGSYGQVPNYANLGQTSAMYTFGLMMMHPIAPGGYAVAPANIPLTATHPVTNGNGPQISST